MYDIIGNINDHSGMPVMGVVVDDGYNGVSTDKYGYYQIKTNQKKLNFRMIGFKQQSVDLTKYKDGSAINLDITLEPDTEATTFKPIEVVAQRTPKNDVAQTSKTLNKKHYPLVGISLVCLGLGLAIGFFYKAFKK